jgi:hypothetical protein
LPVWPGALIEEVGWLLAEAPIISPTVDSVARRKKR